MEEACCTCARLLSTVPRFAEGSEKPLPSPRRLDCCCGRVICGQCISENPRFRSYCPYCPSPSSSSSASSPFPTTTTSRRRRPPPPPPRDSRGEEEELPAYTPSPNPPTNLNLNLFDPPPATTFNPSDPPPAYTHHQPDTPTNNTPKPNNPCEIQDEKAPPLLPTNSTTRKGEHGVGEDLLHFLDHAHDTMTSLSFRYNVPIASLRRANRLPLSGEGDYLLQARRTILIPRHSSLSTGQSLSPRPVEGEAEEARRSKIRRFMVATKVSDYSVACLYLEQAGYDLESAVDMLRDDEAWERDHPLPKHQTTTGPFARRAIVRTGVKTDSTEKR